MSLILNLQCWEGDKVQAMALARLIADIEPKPRWDVVFLFSFRVDCKPDNETVEYVKQKFPRCFTFISRNLVSGWPQGPNNLFSESYQHCIELCRSGRVENCDGILFMEADCVPLRKEWINLLKSEWLKAKNCGKFVLGCWLEKEDCGMKHINGNCIIHKDFWYNNRKILTPWPYGGWDAVSADVMLPAGYPSKEIFSDYRHDTSDNPWKDCGHLFRPRFFHAPNHPLHGQHFYPCWLHGVKSMRGIECVRSRLEIA